jgi:hypothetical protein
MTLVARRMRWGIALAASILTATAGLALVPTTGAASNRSRGVRGGSGVITTHGVGAQRFEVAQLAAIRAFAGNPNSIQYQNKLGEPTSSKHAVWEIWTYQFASAGYVAYSFHHSSGRWVFVEIDTNRQQFQTARGTRVGMSYAEAKKREGVSYTPGCIDSGFWHFRDQHRYAVVVGVDRGQPVHALHGFGPHPPVC